jgi:hypothetical protein
MVRPRSIEEAPVKNSVQFSLGLFLAGILIAMDPAASAERTARAPSVLPVSEIITIVRSAGLTPLGKPTRKGTNYLLRARDEDGQDVRVVVDGRAGEVVAVTPVGYSGREIDPMRPSVYDSGPPVYDMGQPVYRRDVPVIIEQEPDVPVYRRAAPVPVPVAPPPMQREVVVPAPVAPPPPEREVVVAPAPTPDFWTPRPSAAVPVTPPPVMATPTAPPDVAVPEGDENALLPPPPPRFQQRVNLTPAPKPAAKPAAKPTKSAAKTNAKTDATKPDTKKPDAAKASASAPANAEAPTPPKPKAWVTD